MVFKECCKSCLHFNKSSKNIPLWCELRRIQINSQVADIAFCHHWTQIYSLDKNTKDEERKSIKQLEINSFTLN